MEYRENEGFKCWGIIWPNLSLLVNLITLVEIYALEGKKAHEQPALDIYDLGRETIVAKETNSSKFHRKNQ